MTASTPTPAAVPGPLATVRSPLPPPARLSGIPLRPYQQEALAAIEREAARGLRRLLVALPTGAGKTVVVGHLIHRRGGRAVVLVHRDELLEQARDKLCAIDPAAADRVAILRGGGSNTALRAPILVASVQTLARPERLAALPEGIGTVIVDECVTGDTLVVTDGGTKPIRALAGSSGSRVLSYDGVQVLWKNVAAFLPRGERPILEIRLAREGRFDARRITRF